MANTAKVYPGCTCISHEGAYNNWAEQDATLRISSCMRTCPYCGQKFSNASRLRKHLHQRRYRERNIVVEGELAGATGVSSPRCLPKSLLEIPKPRTPLSERSIHPAYPMQTSEKPLQNTCLTMIQEIVERFGSTFGLSSIPDPSNLDEMSENTKSLWCSSTSSTPRLLDASQAWRSRTPLVRELVMEALQQFQIMDHSTRLARSETEYSVNFQGEVDMKVDPFITISQLVDPDPNKAVFVSGLRLPIIDDLGFRVPHDICQIVEPFYEANSQVNLTPTFSFVDLHIDYGADGVSTPIGDCRKIWLLYPPTDSNLQAMKGLDGQRGKLARLAHQLKGCVFVETTSAHALYIPAGCLHATFTVDGGFLVTKDFTTSKSLGAISGFLTKGLDETLSIEARMVCFDWFERCLEMSLSHHQFEAAVLGWTKAEETLLRWASDQRRWRISIRRLWDQVSLDTAKMLCPCGKRFSGSCSTSHFFPMHLLSLKSPSRLRRCRGSLP